MSIEGRPSNEQVYASPEQAGTILKELDNMLVDVPSRDNLKYYREPKERLVICRFVMGVPVPGDESYLRLASIFFFNEDDNGLSLALYEVEKKLPAEEQLVRKTLIRPLVELQSPISDELLDEYMERQRLERRNSGENFASETDAGLLIQWIKNRIDNRSKHKYF